MKAKGQRIPSLSNFNLPFPSSSFFFLPLSFLRLSEEREREAEKVTAGAKVASLIFEISRLGADGMNDKASVSKELNARHRKVPCFTFICIFYWLSFRLVAEKI